MQQETPGQPAFNPLLGKLQALQSVLEEKTRKLEEVEEERNHLLKENEGLMEQLLRMRMVAGQDFSRIGRLVQQIGSICHTVNCNCAEEETK
jgi:hypothetical protein